MTFVGLDTFINGVAISPNGLQIATNASDHSVRLWDITTGIQTTQLEHESQDDLGMAVAYSPDGRYLASSDFNGDVILWDLSTNRPRYTWQHTGYVWRVAFNSNSTLLASVGSDNFLRLWNTRNGNQSRALRSSAPLRGLAISPNGRQILTGSEEGEVILWETSSGDKLMSRSEHDASVNAVAFSPDGNRAASLDGVGMLVIWDLTTGESQQAIQAHDAQAFALLWMPESNIIITGADDGRLILWDGTTGDYLTEQALPNRYIRAIAHTPDETAVLIGTDDGTLILSNLP
jgi:WD40 repeat protein